MLRNYRMPRTKAESRFDFLICECSFEFPLADVVDALATSIHDEAQTHAKRGVRPYFPAAAELHILESLWATFRERLHAHEDASWDTSYERFSQDFVPQLIERGSSGVVICGECKREYSLLNLSCECWQDMLQHESGRRYMCPHGHIVYAVIDAFNI